MGKSSCCLASDIHWGVSAELSDSEFDPEENLDEELESLYFSEVIPKLQFRKDVSVARWDNKLGMAEVIVRKGRMWATTGIVREDKILCHIEEIIFMIERGALLLLDGDLSLSMEDVYSLLMDEKYGCTWEYYQAYCHLKGLGYIVGRHDIPWTLKVNKSKPTSCNLDSSEGLVHEYGRGIANRDISNEDKHCFQSKSIITTSENKRMRVKDAKCCGDGLETTSLNQSGCKVEDASLAESLENLSIYNRSIDSGDHGKGLNLVFDVYSPNTKFKKSAPGLPDFILCIARFSAIPATLCDGRAKVQEQLLKCQQKYKALSWTTEDGMDKRVTEADGAALFWTPFWEKRNRGSGIDPCTTKGRASVLMLASAGIEERESSAMVKIQQQTSNGVNCCGASIW